MAQDVDQDAETAGLQAIFPTYHSWANRETPPQEWD
jgi:hypothetical protein